MKQIKKTCCTLCIIIICTNNIFAQANNTKYNSQKKQIIKLNVMSLYLNSISLQYEHFIGKKISAALGVRVTPNIHANLSPFIGKADSELVNAAKLSRIKTLAITTELRYYTGKQIGKGFYFGPSLRIENDIITFDFGKVMENSNQHLLMKGKNAAATIGIQTGVQFNVGNQFIVDWWIAGLGYGFSKLNASMSSPNFGFKQKDIDDMNKILQQPDGGILNKSKTYVSNQKINLTTNWHSMANFRTGLCIGYRFNSHKKTSVY